MIFYNNPAGQWNKAIGYKNDKSKFIRYEDDNKFILCEDIEKISNYCMDKALSIGIRMCGAASNKRIREGFPCKWHAIMDKSIKEESIKKVDDWINELLDIENIKSIEFKTIAGNLALEERDSVNNKTRFESAKELQKHWKETTKPIINNPELEGFIALWEDVIVTRKINNQKNKMKKPLRYPVGLYYIQKLDHKNIGWPKHYVQCLYNNYKKLKKEKRLITGDYDLHCVYEKPQHIHHNQLKMMENQKKKPQWNFSTKIIKEKDITPSWHELIAAESDLHETRIKSGKLVGDKSGFGNLILENVMVQLNNIISIKPQSKAHLKIQHGPQQYYYNYWAYHGYKSKQMIKSLMLPDDKNVLFFSNTGGVYVALTEKNIKQYYGKMKIRASFTTAKKLLTAQKHIK